jgi:excisionase family DNA binding protein
MIGEHAVVSADITGDSIVIAGKVNGHVQATRELKLIAPAAVIGDIKTPLLSVAEGAVFDGNCRMVSKGSADAARYAVMTPEELAKYLEVDSNMIMDWVNSGKLPGTREGDNWRFDRSKIDEWVAAGKIK